MKMKNGLMDVMFRHKMMKELTTYAAVDAI